MNVDGVGAARPPAVDVVVGGERANEVLVLVLEAGAGARSAFVRVWPDALKQCHRSRGNIQCPSWLDDSRWVVERIALQCPRSDLTR